MSGTAIPQLRVKNERQITVGAGIKLLPPVSCRHYCTSFVPALHYPSFVILTLSLVHKLFGTRVHNHLSDASDDSQLLR